MHKRKTEILIIMLLIVAMVGAAVVGAYATTAAEKRAAAEEAARKAEAATSEADKLYLEGLAKMAEIEEQEATLEETKQKQEAKEKEVKEQQKALNQRLSVMYKTGTVGFVDVILNSNSITELIQNIGVVQKILQSDKELLAQLEDDYAEIEKLKQEQEEQKKKLEEEKAELDSLREEYVAEAEQYEAEEAQLNAEAEELGRAAESSGISYSGGGTAPTAGDACWPTDSDYLYTDYYGWRTDPFTGQTAYHSGYDICLWSGTYGKPCYAVKDGVIAMAEYYGSFGNCVVLDIGNGYKLYYGHLSGFAVSEGQYVSKGQVLGYIGSTGRSTGPHLHFGLYIYGELADPALVVPGMGY